jgi:hypothetical protein
MAAPPLTPHQLRFEVARARQKDPDALVVGLHAPGPWAGGGELELDDRNFAVVRADTVLEVREALAEAEARDRPTVVLTALEQAELGHDVVARLARSKLWPVDPWEGVKGLFKARQLDPALRETCLARALLEHKPPGRDYDPVPAGVLDAGTAWRAILHHALGMEDREPDLPGLLRWAASVGAARYLAAPADLRAAARIRLVGTLGLAAGSVLDVVESGAGREALALALACEVVFAAAGADVPELRAAAARLERHHHDQPIEPDVGRTLARAGNDALDDLARDEPDAAQGHLLRADALLKDVQAAPLAHLGRRTPLAWEARLRRLARALADAAEPAGGGDVATCDAEYRSLADHVLSDTPPYRERLGRARMALRLARWIRTPEDIAGSFGQLARRYVEEHSFVDWARDALGGGDDAPELTDAFARIGRRAGERRAAFSRAFAAALADWTRSGSDPGEVLRVEDVAAQAAAPVLGERVPLLLIVLDGLSWPVARELLADLRRLHWEEALLPGRGGPPPPVVAAIPSVTELSRASLLAGFLHRGKQDDERRLFPANAVLLARSERNLPPLVFHKAGLTEGSRGALSRAVEGAILEPRNRVVAAVINAVDDRLAGASQVRDIWTAEAIRPLGALLRAAREAGRAVVLASDHGHVWHRDAPPTPAAEAAARWRPADGAARDGEVLLEGARVRGPGEAPRLIAAWAEETRYGAARNGYHGGASPQEMLAPLVLLTDATARQPALEPAESRRPAWWDGPRTGRPVEWGHGAPPAPPAPKPRKPSGYLFSLEPLVEAEPVATPDPRTSPAPAPAGGDWPGRLVRSPIYQAQRQAVRKFAPEDELVVQFLEALTGQGGSMTPAALARRVGLPSIRLDGLVAKVQRLLNLDGYDVLRLDRQRELVELDVALLKRQFELE